jgi:hypothetical protein
MKMLPVPYLQLITVFRICDILVRIRIRRTGRHINAQAPRKIHLPGLVMSRCCCCVYAAAGLHKLYDVT